MKERKEISLLRKIVEFGGLEPAPERITLTDSHYELVIPITKESSALIYISKSAYFDLMEKEYNE